VVNDEQKCRNQFLRETERVEASFDILLDVTEKARYRRQESAGGQNGKTAEYQSHCMHANGLSQEVKD